MMKRFNLVLGDTLKRKREPEKAPFLDLDGVETR